MQEFEFPIHEELFQEIASINELRQLLQQQAIDIRLNKQQYRILNQKGKYIYAKCRKCKSFLRYFRQEQRYRLTGFNNFHSHSQQKRGSQIEAFIRTMPLTMSTQSLMQITTNTFHIPASKFYYHNQKLWSEKIDLKQIINQLDYQKHQTRYLPFPLQQGDLPDIFLTASPAMIQRFNKYGLNQFITFDVTYNLVKEIKNQYTLSGQIKQKRWGLGCFLGKNCNNKAICFAICLLNTQTKESFIGIFKSFFEMMKGEPSVVITDEQSAIAVAIQQLKQDGQYQGQHLWDTFHILRNVSKKTKNKQLCRSLRDAMFAKTHEEYKKKLQASRELCTEREDINIYNRFIQNSQRYCISQTPLCLHGVSISTSYGEKVNDFIKTYIPSQKPYKVVLRKLLKVMEQLQEKSHEEKLCKVHYQDLFEWRQLKLLRHVTCETIFMEILKNYIDSLPMKMTEEMDTTWIVDEHQLAIKEGKVMCACGYYQKCGIPCSHLIKLIIELHEDILNYIHKRWKLDIKKDTSKYKIKRGRPRISRRQRK